MSTITTNHQPAAAAAIDPLQRKLLAALAIVIIVIVGLPGKALADGNLPRHDALWDCYSVSDQRILDGTPSAVLPDARVGTAVIGNGEALFYGQMVYFLTVTARVESGKWVYQYGNWLRAWNAEWWLYGEWYNANSGRWETLQTRLQGSTSADSRVFLPGPGSFYVTEFVQWGPLVLTDVNGKYVSTVNSSTTTHYSQPWDLVSCP